MANQTRCCESRGGLVCPILLILAGALLLAGKFDMIEVRDIWQLWPLALIGLGVHMLLKPAERRS